MSDKLPFAKSTCPFGLNSFEEHLVNVLIEQPGVAACPVDKVNTGR